MKRFLVLAVATITFGLLGWATPAYATPFTINFSGSVDLSSVGGPALNTFSGSIEWESTDVAFETNPNDATYDPRSYTLIFNGVDVSAPIIGSGTGSGITIANDVDFFQPGVPEDVFLFFLSFPSPFQVSGADGDLILVAALTGPTTMFTSTALPGSLDFLGQVATSQSLWAFQPDGENDFLLDPQGTLVVSTQPQAVPEPASLLLFGAGAIGLLAKARRRKQQAR